MAGPWEKYGGQAGPVYGPPPKVPPFAVEDQEFQRNAEARAAEDQEFQREKFDWEREQREKDRVAGVGRDAKMTESENKAAAFLIRALGSNEAYEGAGVGPRSLIGQQMADTAPNILNTLPGFIGNSPERQVADSAQDEFIAASLRQDSGAAIPEEELERQRRIYFPMPGDSEEAIAQKRAARLRAIEGLKQSSGRLEESAEARYRAMVGEETPPQFSPGDPQYQAATGGSRRINDPQLAAEIDAMLRQGASFGQLNSYVRSKGGQPIDPRQYAAVRAFLKKNPDYEGSLVDATRYEPISAVDQLTTAAGDNPAGSYLMGAGQFLSGNTLDNLAGDPERARLAMEMGRARNPTATALGEITGGVLAGMTGEAGLARLGMGSGLARGVAADSVMGGANAAGAADNGNRLSAMALGAGTGAAGSALGSGAINLAGRAVSPSGGSLAGLYEAGVRPTIGQRYADSGVVGRAVNATEEALQSVPIVGAAIGGARQEARDQFQVGAFNQALAEIGEVLPKGMKPGADPHKFTQEAFSRVYDKARSGMRMIADEKLAEDLGTLAGEIATLGPSAQNKLKAILANSVNSKLVGGEMPGGAYKQAVSDLGKHIARNRKGLLAEEQALADVLEGVQDALDSAARRHSDPAAVELLDAADAGYSKFVRIEDAARRRGGDSSTFSPTQFDAAVQNVDGGIRSKRYLRGEAPMQDYAKQGLSLRDRMANSGTADRALAATTVAGGAAYLEPSTLAVLGAIGTAYAPGVRKVTKGVLAPSKNQTTKAISSQLKKRARLVGAATAASGVAALPGTAPAQ